ncbi:MAG TPA: hypothetical protein DDW49_06570 [Deltaproteobacteria bacterium]|nr:hypothetical protein [Deltaproteobacteria bacterium]
MAATGQFKGSSKELSSGYEKKDFHFNYNETNPLFERPGPVNTGIQLAGVENDFTTYFIGGRGQTYGPGVTSGYFYRADPSRSFLSRFGYFSFGEGAIGLEGGLSAEAGAVKGSLMDMTLNINFGVVVGGSAILNPENGDPLGWSINIGGSISSSASWTKGVTERFFLDDFQPLFNLFK